MNTTSEHEALTAVLNDAGAKPCVRCGKRAAVYTLASSDADLGLDQAGDAFVWFCFECGHEESVAH